MSERLSSRSNARARTGRSAPPSCQVARISSGIRWMDAASSANTSRVSRSARCRSSSTISAGHFSASSATAVAWPGPIRRRRSARLPRVAGPHRRHPEIVGNRGHFGCQRRLSDAGVAGQHRDTAPALRCRGDRSTQPIQFPGPAKDLFGAAIPRQALRRPRLRRLPIEITCFTAYFAGKAFQCQARPNAELPVEHQLQTPVALQGVAAAAPASSSRRPSPTRLVNSPTSMRSEPSNSRQRLSSHA